MDLNEIINRPDKTPIEQEEAFSVIKEYIKAKKGMEVNLQIETRFGILEATREVNIMHHLLNTDLEYFRRKLPTD